MDAEIVVGLLGALGAGSVLGQWVSSAKDRRASRAAVLVAIGNVERARWAPTQDAQAFRDAARELMSAGLLARVSRQAVTDYVVFGQAARWLSEASWEDNPVEEDGGGGIASEYADVVREAQATLAGVVWSPLGLKRLTLRHRLRNLQTRADAAAAADRRVEQTLQRARTFGAG